MALISLKNICKSYIDREILEDVSFHLEEQDKIGLIGVNGSGKSTLIKIITGEISKDSGDIHIQKNLKLGYLSQLTEIEPSSTVYNEALKVFTPLIEMEKQLRDLESQMSDSNLTPDKLEVLMRNYANLQERFEKDGGFIYLSSIRGVLKGLGFTESDYELTNDKLSGGQKARLALAKLLLSNPDILLLDEPTNHLDIDATLWLEKYLRDYNGAIIVISHDRYFLNSFVNKIILLENRQSTIFKGDYNTYIKERKKQIEQLRKQYEDQQKEIKRQEEIIKRFLSMGRDRFIKQGQSRQKLLDKMKTVEAPNEKKVHNFSFTPSVQSGKDVMEAEDVSKYFDDKLLFDNVNFNIYRNDKIGLIGGNGVGKSTLMKILKGTVEPSSGSVHTGTKVEIGYFDQEMENLHMDNTIIDEIWDEYPKLTHLEIRRYLAKFMFIGDDIFKMIEDLSGGEKGRVSTLKLMLSKSNFLLMDEPTNHLDIDSKEVLEDALIDYEGTILVISHDRYFLNRVCNKIYHMVDNTLVEYDGNYDYYLEKSKIEDEEEEHTVTKTSIYQQKKKSKEEAKKVKAQLQLTKDLEKEIEILEEQLKEIDNELANPENYEVYKKVQELTNERGSTEELLNVKYEKWMALE